MHSTPCSVAERAVDPEQGFADWTCHCPVEELAKLGGSLPATEVAFTERRQAASKLLSAVSQSAAYEPGLSHKLLDHTSLPGCGDTCVEEALKVGTTHLTLHPAQSI